MSSTGTQSAHNYVLGNSPEEQERLKQQARILGGWTREFFLAAGISPGMHVLDLGCGMGDVALLAAELVGPTGSVTAVDRDPVVIEQACERIARETPAAPIDFTVSAIAEFQGAREFDALVGRYILLYQPDPVAALKHAASQVRPGGVIVFHEVLFGSGPVTYPESELFTRLDWLLGETFRKVGFRPDFGLMLAETFLDAGLGWPTVEGRMPVGSGPGSYLYGWMAETIRSVLPRMEQFGLATAEEIDIGTLAARLEAEAVANKSQWVGPMQFGAWTRKAC